MKKIFLFAIATLLMASTCVNGQDSAKVCNALLKKCDSLAALCKDRQEVLKKKISTAEKRIMYYRHNKTKKEPDTTAMKSSITLYQEETRSMDVCIKNYMDVKETILTANLYELGKLQKMLIEHEKKLLWVKQIK